MVKEFVLDHVIIWDVGYQGVPIGITVEGANILTRSLIIFGQGVIRCHPYVLAEMESARENNLVEFDKAFWGHFSFVLANYFKSIFFVWTNGYLIQTPNSKVKRYYQLIHRYSSHLSFLSDFSMAILGGKLKRKEKLSARLGDLLSYLYLASSVVKRFYDDKEPDTDLNLIHWCCQHLFYECEKAIQQFISNFPLTWARVFLKLLLQPFGRQRKAPSDDLDRSLAQMLTTPGDARTRLTRRVYAKASENCPLGILEQAFFADCG